MRFQLFNSLIKYLSDKISQYDTDRRTELLRREINDKKSEYMRGLYIAIDDVLNDKKYDIEKKEAELKLLDESMSPMFSFFIFVKNKPEYSGVYGTNIDMVLHLDGEIFNNLTLTIWNKKENTRKSINITHRYDYIMSRLSTCDYIRDYYIKQNVQG